MAFTCFSSFGAKTEYVSALNSVKKKDTKERDIHKERLTQRHTIKPREMATQSYMETQRVNTYRERGKKIHIGME